LKRFDRLVAVDGQPLVNKTTSDVSQLIRGTAGSSVTLTIERGGQSMQVSVTRAPIQVPPVQASLVAPGVAYLQIFEFSQGAGRQLRAGIQALQAQGPIRSAVLDLRGNPGGLITEAASVGGVFLPAGTVLARIHERGQAPSVLQTSGQPVLPGTPLVVLVDGQSASASEILAGAFKDYGRATIVGAKTAGALGGSIMVALPEGGMSVTVESILTPKNERVEGVGVAPDLNVSLTATDMEHGQDTQLQAALHALGTAVTLPARTVLAAAAERLARRARGAAAWQIRVYGTPPRA
jgi:carboxyl-terminal processing protease